MYLIQILLPARSREGPVEDAAFTKTREELVAVFEGVTAYTRAPAQGTWVAPDGDQERDDVVMVEVMAEAFDRSWWREFARKLADRFAQEEIHIRALPAETP